MSETPTYAAKTPLRASQNAGQPQLSMAISMPFSLPLPEFQPVSVINNGFSSSGFSWSCVPSMSTSMLLLFASLRPLDIGFVGLAFVSREVTAYSQSFAAVSQSSTVPSLDMGLLIPRLAMGVCIELSPKRSFSLEFGDERTP